MKYAPGANQRKTVAPAMTTRPASIVDVAVFPGASGTAAASLTGGSSTARRTESSARPGLDQVAAVGSALIRPRRAGESSSACDRLQYLLRDVEVGVDV